MPSRKHIRPTMDVEAITERLDRALDDLLAVRVAVGGLPVEPPAEGLDAHRIQPFYAGLLAKACGVTPTMAMDGDSVVLSAQ